MERKREGQLVSEVEDDGSTTRLQNQKELYALACPQRQVASAEHRPALTAEREQRFILQPRHPHTVPLYRYVPSDSESNHAFFALCPEFIVTTVLK